MIGLFSGYTAAHRIKRETTIWNICRTIWTSFYIMSFIVKIVSIFPILISHNIRTSKQELQEFLLLCGAFSGLQSSIPCPYSPNWPFQSKQRDAVSGFLQCRKTGILEAFAFVCAMSLLATHICKHSDVA